MLFQCTQKDKSVADWGTRYARLSSMTLRSPLPSCDHKQTFTQYARFPTDSCQLPLVWFELDHYPLKTVIIQANFQCLTWNIACGKNHYVVMLHSIHYAITNGVFMTETTANTRWGSCRANSKLGNYAGDTALLSHANKISICMAPLGSRNHMV